MPENRYYIPRRLSWTDKELKRQSIHEDQLIDHFDCPVVVLGDPGMGKTWLVERLSEQAGRRFIRARSLLRQPDGSDFGGDLLVIDGLDEVSALNESDPLNSVLTKLIACGKPRFVISCRSAEWRAKSAELDIADEYGVAPQTVDLELLTETEALEALSRRGDALKARHAIFALREAGLEGFFQNPLYLDFVAAIVRAEQNVPKSRAELYDQAVSQLCIEPNPHHMGRGIDTLPAETALDAAGALMAALVITGKSTVSLAQATDEALHINELAEFENLSAMRTVLGSNLFKTLSGQAGHFAPIHATVAAFLGARWLGRYVDRYIDEQKGPAHVVKRIQWLIASESGVPSSMRGLHAWLPKFSPTRLGPSAIGRDPYGVIRYGDGDNLGKDQASALIGALRRQSQFDPYFRDGWSRSEAIGGLAQPALLEQIRQIITDDDETVAFRSLFLEALIGSDLTPSLSTELQTIMFDVQRAYRERREASDAIAAMSQSNFDWADALDRILSLGDPDSTRLAAELLDSIGYERLKDEQIARVVITEGRLTADSEKKRIRTFGTLYPLQYGLPEERIVGLLDTLATKLLPYLDPKKWWGGGYEEGWSDFRSLVHTLTLRQLEHDAAAVSPQQLWNWLSMIERQHGYGSDERKAISEKLKNNDRLRRGVQRIALTAPGEEQRFFENRGRLTRLSNGFIPTDEDALLLLQEIVARGAPTDRERWMALVSHFRNDGIIPVPVRKIARPYAKGDQELMDFLVKKPKRQKLDEWELKFRRSQRDRRKREEAKRQKAQETYLAHIEEVKSGERRWIVWPAEIYLHHCLTNSDEPPETAVDERLGRDVRDASFEGFEAVLHRNDLPTADQIAKSYAESQTWYYVYPMLAGAGERWRNGKGFDDLSSDIVSALLIADSHHLVVSNEFFSGFEDALRDRLAQNSEIYEAHVRRMFEPMLAAKQKHIHGLYRFTRSKSEHPLSVNLSAEWLERFPDLPLEVEDELAECILHAPEELRESCLVQLAGATRKRLAGLEPDSEAYKYWRGIQFSFDAAEAIANLPPLTNENRDWLWALTHPLYQCRQEHEHYVPASLGQLKWLVTAFRPLWPYRNRPSGTTHGDKNEWDATELIEWAIYQIGKNPSEDAAALLRELRDMPQDGYTRTIQANIASQQRARLEAHFSSPPLSTYKAVLSASGQPQNSADVQAIILSELEALQDRLHGDPLNPVNNFYDDGDKPKNENACRDQMLLLMGDNLAYGIQAPPEVAMPLGKRSDGAFTFGTISVPLECKGQWHKDVWTAAATQLDRHYAIHHKAAKKGIYVVFWFGAKAPTGRKLKTPPKGTARPTTANEMREALQALLPVELRDDIAIIVLDLTRP